MSKSTKNALTRSGDYSDDNVELIPLMYKMCKKNEKYDKCVTGVRGLTRGMATLLQDNQEQLLVGDKVGRPQVSLT